MNILSSVFCITNSARVRELTPLRCETDECEGQERLWNSTGNTLMYSTDDSSMTNRICSHILPSPHMKLKTHPWDKFMLNSKKHMSHCSLFTRPFKCQWFESWDQPFQWVDSSQKVGAWNIGLSNNGVKTYTLVLLGILCQNAVIMLQNNEISLDVLASLSFCCKYQTSMKNLGIWDSFFLYRNFAKLRC